ncbi:phthalate dioxygenase reductase [mine drainage metagenome]|uniref:Phthalate dioxygenase reductase n=1 Tax=mine drainage metagenome TaxID=410659 RepID=A0A1J5SFS3_9ZZZZ
MNTLAVRIARIARETDEIASFELVSADGSALPEFTPGAHIDVHVAGLIRQYSLCNAPEDSSRYLIAVKREPESRGGSRAMHERLRAGDVLEIGAPRNNFPLDQTTGSKLLLAAGIGVTPLLSMARQLLGRGTAFELHYFTRSAEHTAFRDLLAGPGFKERTSLHYGLDPEALREYLRGLLAHRSAGAQLYLCGPRPFMDLVVATAAMGWPPEAVHLEYFAAAPQPDAVSERAFTVRLARSGASYVIPEDKTIVAALAAQGVDIPTSCEQGICGTCLTGVIEGIPDHRDAFLSDEEKRAGKQILPCVSRAKSPLLVLDL